VDTARKENLSANFKTLPNRFDGLAVLLQPRGVAGHRRVVVRISAVPVSTTMSSPLLSKLGETRGCRRMFASRLASA
jgi:hypothetical protein